MILLKKLIVTCLIFLAFFSVSPKLVAALPPGIDWYSHGVQSAFEYARKSSKPLFLYWGAVWCPPCNQIKKTIFSTEQFRIAVKDFIPVYLDGDSKDAQSWGEKLKTSGYPTMLVMTGDFKEVMRLPTGLSVEEFVGLMKSSLEKLKPLREIIKLALEGKGSEGDWQRIAAYSWGQDEGISVDIKARPSTFKKLFEKVPSGLSSAKSRLFLLYQLELMSGGQNKKCQKEDCKYFETILQSDRLYFDNLETLSWNSKEFLNYFALDRRGIDLYKNKAKLFNGKKELSVDGRLSALIPLLELEQINPDLQKLIRTQVAWANQTALDQFERQAAMSTVMYLLQKSKQLKEAREFALLEIKKSQSPFYIMSDLASIEKEAGNKELAVEWYKKAWQVSVGDNTRFQWGTSYVVNLFELLPEHEEQIAVSMKELIREVLTTDDAFRGRNLKRFEKLSKKLHEWGKNSLHQTAYSNLQSWIKNEISKLPESEKRREGLKWLKTL